ncbi:MAG: response regulator transcription factor [Bacteroidota bacterium]
MITISIYDDNDSLRETLAWVVESCDDFWLRGAYPNCMDVVESVKRDKPDVILMDIDMPGRTGIEAVRLIHQYLPKPPKIIMITVYEDTDSIFEALQAGAIGYLLKKTSKEKIIESIREIHQGGAVMTPSIALKVMTAFQQPKSNPYSLTEKETLVLKRLVEGDSYKLIAHHCQMSISTVQTHIVHIYQKLMVNSKGEAITKAFRDNLV